MKEMVGGCCVCSDERGWQENPLVYCDGQDCSVAVHQACYGIVSVPTGPWFCEKCVSGENSSRFRCDLCPMREGALKRTDKNGWAHVVCALYIPEVRFGNVSTMDPIILSQVPADRFNKVCYICEDKGSIEKSKAGACMQCNKNGCKACFHVTCAQQEGLLCEESGVQDNIKYCGYCSHHFKKLRKGDPSIKAIPPYRPVYPASAASTIGSSANKEKNSVNVNNRNLSSVGGNHSNVHNNSNNNSNNNNHHSTNTNTNQRENCIKPSPNTSKLATTSAPIATSSNFQTVSNTTTMLAVSTTSTSTASISTIGSSQSKPTIASSTAVATSGIFIPTASTTSSSSLIPPPPPPPPPQQPQPQPLSSSTRPLVSSVDGGSETAWTKPVPHISYLGFNNDLLHSNTSGLATAAAATTTNASTTSILTPMAAISSVIPPTGFGPKTNAFPGPRGGVGGGLISTTASSLAGPITAAPVVENTIVMAPIAVTTTTTMTTAAVSGRATPKSGKVTPAPNGGQKRKSESKDQSGDQETKPDKPKKSRRSATKKTVKSLLELVSPVVEDTVSSFQREKVASQRNELFQQQQQQQLQQNQNQQLHQQQQLQQQQIQQQQHMQQQHQHQQSSIDSVIAATAAGHPAAQFLTTVVPERPVAVPVAATAAPAAIMVPEAVEQQPSLTIPVANLIAPPPPPKSTSFRSPQEASSLTGGASAFPTSLEQLLERQWEQGSQFLMEQAQHFDIASLLSCLHQLKMENQRLEDHVVNLAGRRDHLLAVNARLSLSLGQQHQSPNSPRINTATSMATPFLHLQAPNSQDSSHDTSENSASSRLSAPPNSSTPIALHPSFVGATNLPVLTTSKAMQTPTAVSSSSIVVSPTNRSALGSLTAATAATSNFAMVPSGSGGGSVFSSVKSKPSQEPSPDRLQQPMPGSFLIPRAPTPMLATDLVRPQTSLVANQYPVLAQDPQRMFYQLMQQNVLAQYGTAFSTLMQQQQQSSSPHRAAAAAVLAQSHLTSHSVAPSLPPSTQEKS